MRMFKPNWFVNQFVSQFLAFAIEDRRDSDSDRFYIERAINQIPFINSVKLTFPRVHDRELWSTVAVLSKASTYFETMLASSFAEGAVVPTRAAGKRKRVEEVEEEESDHPLFEDSDDETDKQFHSSLNTPTSLTYPTYIPSPSEPSSPAPHPFRKIDIRQASLTTYAAVLC